MCIRDRYSTCLLRALRRGIGYFECGYGPTKGMDVIVYISIWSFMCTWWMVCSELVRLFCVVFSSSNFIWLFLCFYDTHLVASLEHSGATCMIKFFLSFSLILAFTWCMCGLRGHVHFCKCGLVCKRWARVGGPVPRTEAAGYCCFIKEATPWGSCLRWGTEWESCLLYTSRCV